MLGFIKRGLKTLGSNVLQGAKTLGASTVQHVIPTPLMALYDFISRQPLLKNFSRQAQAFLSENGDSVIQRIEVSRTLLSSAMNKMLNLVSLGKFNEAKDDLNMDKLYHLFMIITYYKNGMKQVILEKNERPRFVQANARGGEMVSIPISPSLTINEMCNNAIKSVGASRYFVYDAFNRTNAGGNCQRFIDDNLRCSREISYTQQARQFILQNAQELIKRLPQYTGNVAQALTNFFSRLKTGLY